MNYVLGLGNILMSDDGFGPAVIRAFEEQYEVGPDVEVVDLGTPGLDLMPWLADAGCVIIVDAVNVPLDPGSLRIYNKSDLMSRPPGVRVNPHDPGLKETLQTLEFAGRAPRDVIVVGVVPASVEMGLELTAPVRRVVPLAVEVIDATLEWFGITAEPRSRVDAH